MRISDWSSDVCSSDLGADGEQALARPLLAAGDRELAGRMAHVEQLPVVPRGSRLQHRHVGKAVVQAGGAIVAEQQRPPETGGPGLGENAPTVSDAGDEGLGSHRAPPTPSPFAQPAAGLAAVTDEN